MGQLLFGTLRNLETADLGMRTAGILVFGITPQASVHSGAEAVRFHVKLLNGLRALPGVDHATVSEERLGSGVSSNDGVLVDGRSPLPREPFAPMRVNAVGSEFLRTLGIPVHLGRDFSEADILSSNRTAIVSRRLPIDICRIQIPWDTRLRLDGPSKRIRLWACPVTAATRA